MISPVGAIPSDFLQSGNVENAIFLFRKSGDLSDALITKDNLAASTTLVNGFKNLVNIATCNDGSISVNWAVVASELSSRNIGPSISGGVAERVNDGSCFGWAKDAGAGAGTPGTTNGPPENSQKSKVFIAPNFDFVSVSYEYVSGLYTNVVFNQPTGAQPAKGSIPTVIQGSQTTRTPAFDPTFDSVTVTVNVGNLNPTDLEYNIKIWKDAVSSGIGTLDYEVDELLMNFTLGGPSNTSSTISKTITIPNDKTGGLVFIEVVTTPGTCYRSQVKALIGTAALPVKFKSLDLTSIFGLNKISWITSTEQNNKGFEVQLSIGSPNSFSPIGFVGTRAKDGNSQVEIGYSYEDRDVKSGVLHYYRLKQVDLDGKTSYSAIKSIKPGSIESNLTVFPNPSQGSFTLTTGAASGKVNVFLIDNTGRVINQYLNVSSSNTKFNNLKKGFYTLKIVDVESGEQSAQRVVVQ